MYLHLGQDTVITTKSIIGIFDMDRCTVSKKKWKAKRAEQGDTKFLCSALFFKKTGPLTKAFSQ